MPSSEQTDEKVVEEKVETQPEEIVAPEVPPEDEVSKKLADMDAKLTALLTPEETEAKRSPDEQLPTFTDGELESLTPKDAQKIIAVIEERQGKKNAEFSQARRQLDTHNKFLADAKTFRSDPVNESLMQKVKPLAEKVLNEYSYRVPFGDQVAIALGRAVIAAERKRVAGEKKTGDNKEKGKEETIVAGKEKIEKSKTERPKGGMGDNENFVSITRTGKPRSTSEIAAEVHKKVFGD